MRHTLARLAALACGIAAVAAIAMPASASASTAPAPRAVPAFTKTVVATVKCAQFHGTIEHGGDGSIASPGFIIVKGTLNASCRGILAWVQVHYQNGHVNKGPFVVGKKIRGVSKANVVYDAHDRLNTYAHIFIQACIVNTAHKTVCGGQVTA